MTKQATAGLSSLVGVLLVPVLMLPTAVCLAADPFLKWAVGYEGVSIGLLLAVVFLAVTVFAYRASLEPAGRFLMQREQAILDKLAVGEE